MAGVEYFEKHVRPLLVKHCYECHSRESGNRNGGLWLDSRAGWEVGGETGPAIIPGDVDSSLLVRAIRYAEQNLKMPPGGRLPKEVVARLEQWVELGAPDPRNSATGAAEDAGTDPSHPIAGRTHWAFRPLAGAATPDVTNDSWPQRSLDRFVLTRLHAEGLAPAPDADRRILIRRLYVQLIGLPPTPEQVADFLNDLRPDAVERLVDSLLGSNQYGERWGRHWLDLARYADSNGLDENFLFREAWRYRNWVIDAVNDDMPFDRFLLEQIAGDLLSYESVEQRDSQRIGTGFLVVGPKVLLGLKSEKQRMEVADEQIDTIGRAILGQTLGCARCHDHKFDPVPTRDYYALAGIFTSTQVMETRHMLNQQRKMERLAGLGPEGAALDEAYEKYWRERKAVNKRLAAAKSVLKLLKRADEQGFNEQLHQDKSAVAEGASDAETPMEQRIAVQETLISELDRVVSSPAEIPPRAMVATEAASPADEHIRAAGEFDAPEELVPRGVLQVLGDDAIEIPVDQSGRRQLAHWLTDVEHGAGRLTARVLANRIWHQILGRGIVRTTDNFGRTGDLPSHPDLLDHLATQLIESGWSIKSLVRQIVLSRTNQMSNRHDATAYAKDPENRLLWKFRRRRLDPESLRDAMLQASGHLDLSPMESTVWYLDDQATGVGTHPRRRTDFPNRSIYLPVIRNDLPELFEVFDFTDPQMATGRRPETTVATQGLYLLNADLVMDAADGTARRLLSESGDEQDRVTRMFELILNANPDENEQQALLTFIANARQRLAADELDEPEVRAWAMTCHALFASSRFQMLE